jgi:putative ATPase
MQLGLPEARIPLSQAVILLCTSPKSNSAICAIDDAISDIKSGNTGDVPDSIKDGHYSGAKKLGKSIGYQYPHNFPNSYIKQQYLPDKIKDKVYYKFGENKAEQSALQYRRKITSE